ncbi:MAG: glycosyltransferase family 2 protein [Candidatus Gottesmanbacteria bacterium]
MLTSIIIPNFNGGELLEKNLPEILKTGVDEVIIVDDGSSDNSLERIKKIKQESSDNICNLKIIENNKNLGFASSVNRGVAAAIGDIVILLNTDITPEANFIKPLIDDFQDQNIFAVGCMDKSIEDNYTILRGRGVAKWERGLLVHDRGEIDSSDTFWVSGGSGAFRRRMWIELGGMDNIYFPFYWEDIDLSYRALKAGYQILFDSRSVVVHQHEEGIIKKKYKPLYIKTVSYRNQFIFVWKNITDFKMLSSNVFWLPYYLIKSLLTCDFSFYIGLLWFLLKLPQVITTRRNVRKFFVKLDKEIIL